METLYERKGLGGGGVEVDGRDVFWAELTKEAPVVFAAPKDGSGPVRTLGQWRERRSPDSLALDEDFVYWIFGSGVARVPKDGSAAPEVLPIPGVGRIDLGPIIDAGAFIVVASHACHEVVKVPKDGSTPTTFTIDAALAFREGNVTALHHHGDTLFCGNGPMVHALDLKTGKSTVEVDGGRQIGALASADGQLFWEGGRDNQYAIFGKAIGAREIRYLGPGFGNTGRLHFDSQRRRIYWIGNVTLAYIDLAEGKETTLVRRVDRGGGTAHDSDFVYWAGNGAGTVFRARK